MTYNTAWGTFSVIDPRSLVQISRSELAKKKLEKLTLAKWQTENTSSVCLKKLVNYLDSSESDFETSSSSDDTDYDTNFESHHG